MDAVQLAADAFIERVGIHAANNHTAVIPLSDKDSHTGSNPFPATFRHDLNLHQSLSVFCCDFLAVENDF